ncbi:sensor histidine kinase [Streptomyces sp. NPDC059785]|uniref:sensor histidine kinase n=1 Tax=Streptomyces sp. NPDC059785 TaxID=3346945 RepID=UPI00365F5ABA
MSRVRAAAPREYARAVAARWDALGATTRDAVVVLLLVPVVYAPVTAPLGAQLSDLPRHPYDVPAVLLSVALWLPLVVRRRWPGVCLALVACAFAAHELLGGPQTLATVGLYAALYAAGAHAARPRGPRLALTAAAVVAGYLLFAFGLDALDSPLGPTDYVLFAVILAVCWGVGRTVRAWRDAETDRRRLSVQAATARERARIARELHDVVTHHVTAMVVQADAAQFLLEGAPDKVGTGLEAISSSGRSALTDLQHLLGVLKADGSPTGGDDGEGAPGGAAPDAAERAPRPGSLAELVERTRAAGQPVELTERGERRALASGVELAAYRVVQEALTNALKHAPGHRTVVQVQYGKHELEVEVANDGAPGAGGGGVRRPLGRGGGHGLIGLRERVSVFGGELSAGARPGGGFSVRARIPSGRPA